MDIWSNLILSTRSRKIVVYLFDIRNMDMWREEYSGSTLNRFSIWSDWSDNAIQLKYHPNSCVRASDELQYTHTLYTFGKNGYNILTIFPFLTSFPLTGRAASSSTAPRPRRWRWRCAGTPSSRTAGSRGPRWAVQCSVERENFSVAWFIHRISLLKYLREQWRGGQLLFHHDGS